MMEYLYETGDDFNEFLKSLLKAEEEDIVLRVRTGQEASPVGCNGKVLFPRYKEIAEVKVNGEFIPLDRIGVRCWFSEGCGFHGLHESKVGDVSPNQQLFTCPPHVKQSAKLNMRFIDATGKLFQARQAQLMEDLVYDGIEGEVELPTRDQLGELFEKLGGSYELKDDGGVDFDSVQLDTDAMNEALSKMSQDRVPNDKVSARTELDDDGERIPQLHGKYKIVQLNLKRGSELAREYGEGPFFFVLYYRNAKSLYRLVAPFDKKKGGACALPGFEVHAVRESNPKQALAYAHFGMQIENAAQERREDKKKEFQRLLQDNAWLKQYALTREELFGPLFGAIVDADKEGQDFQTFWTKRRGRDGQVRDGIDGMALAEYVLCVERGLPFREEGGDHQPRPIVAGGTDLEIENLRNLRQEPFCLLQYFDREQSEKKFFVMEYADGIVMAELLMEMGQYGRRVPKKGEEEKFPQVYVELPLKPFPLSTSLPIQKRELERSQKKARRFSERLEERCKEASSSPPVQRKRRQRKPKKSAEQRLAERRAREATQSRPSPRRGGRRRKRNQPEA